MVNIKKKYKPIFYRGMSLDTEEPFDTLEEAEERIADRARRSQWDRDEPFDYAEITIVYVPDDSEDEEDDLHERTW